MSKFFTLVFLLFISTIHVNSATISGKVIFQQSKKSAYGVSILLVGTNRGTLSSIEGLFTIKDVEDSTITLRITGLETIALTYKDISIPPSGKYKFGHIE